MRILMLLTDAFGGFGGISKFNRDFLRALNASTAVERVYVWPRLIPEAIVRQIPEAIVYEREFSGSKYRYLARAFQKLATLPPIDLVICGHLNLLPAAWFVARARRARLALIIHGIDAWTPSSNVLTNRLAGRVDALLSVSRFSAEKFTSWSGLPERLCTILPNCVDLERFTPGEKSPVLLARYGLSGSRVLITVGRLASAERYKGFDEVIEAMPLLLTRFPDLKYLIVGDGPDRARLMRKAETFGVKNRVVFTGRISEDEKVEHYRLADVYVMPSSGEGFGIVLIEAAACGVPVIGSCMDGSRDALLEGRLGKLVNPTAPSEIRLAVTESLKTSSPRLRPQGIERFSVEEFFHRVDNWLTLQAPTLGTHLRASRRSPIKTKGEAEELTP